MKSAGYQFIPEYLRDAFAESLTQGRAAPNQEAMREQRQETVGVSKCRWRDR
jgi:hypothetical protein